MRTCYRVSPYAVLVVALMLGLLATPAEAADNASDGPPARPQEIDPDTDYTPRESADIMRELQQLPGAVMNGSTVLVRSGTVGFTPMSLSLSDCPSGWTCLFDFDDFSGAMWQFQSTGSWQFLTTYGASNRMESIGNRRGFLTRLYDQSTGTYFCISRYSSNRDVGAAYSNNMDQIFNSGNQLACT